MVEGSSWRCWCYFFFAKRKYVKVGKRKVKNVPEGDVGSKRKKIGGELRHSVHTLKKVARLSSKDRREILNTLKKRARKRRDTNLSKHVNEEVSQGSSDTTSSSASENKDWNHWAVLHGKEKEAAEDVWWIGKAIGLHFEGDTHNMFSVLSRSGNGKRETKNCDDGERGSSAGGES